MAFRQIEENGPLFQAPPAAECAKYKRRPFRRGRERKGNAVRRSVKLHIQYHLLLAFLLPLQLSRWRALTLVEEKKNRREVRGVCKSNLKIQPFTSQPPMHCQLSVSQGSNLPQMAQRHRERKKSYEGCSWWTINDIPCLSPCSASWSVSYYLHGYEGSHC